MAINNRAEFAEYCLRKLGKPVITINVAPEQVEDRIDEAVKAWQEKHYDGTEREWVAYTMTEQDVLNGYVTVPDDIIVVDQMMPMSTLYRENASDSLFSYRYQYFVQNMSPFQPLDMLNYYLTMTNLSEVNDMVNTTERFEFVRHKNRLSVFRGTWTTGEVLCFHVYRQINPDANPKAWQDKWLQQYATALIKQNWGSNMKKHGEIQLLGGVTVNGQQIFDEAVTELQALEEQLQDTYQEPVGFQVG